PSTQLIPPEEVDDLLHATAREFTTRLEASVRKTLTSVEGEYGVPVLFSGGVDSLMVAILAGRVLSEPTQVILVNVAFGDTVEACSEAPDRQRCMEAFKYLHSLDSKYRLLLVNVTKEELVRCREEFIARAVSPLNSVLDDSLGCVLWFASRAQGVEYVPEGVEGTNGHAQSRLLPRLLPFTLAGSGSDEQLGGYSRHRSRFENDSFEGLAAELHMEMCRIGRRNFGRDDRVTSSNGRPALYV
ncbi:Asparagine synthase family protein, partial [Aphelenchoides avenae]